MEDYKTKFENLIQRIYDLTVKGCIDEKVGKAILKDFTFESEDERIRKALIKSFEINDLKALIIPGFSAKDVIAWLEKVGKNEEINEASYRAGIKRVLDNPESYGLEKQGEQKNTEYTLKDDVLSRFAFYQYDNDTIYLSSLFVRESDRRCGYGSKVLKAAEEVAKTFGISKIRLKVERNTWVEEWYKKNGYEYLSSEGEYDWLEKQGERKQNVTDIISDLENYFATTTKEQQEKDWGEIKDWEEKHFNHDRHIEQKSNEISPIFRVGDYIRNKKTGDKVLIKQLDIATKAYCHVSYDGVAVNHSDFPFSKQDEWELIGQKVVEQNHTDKVEPKFKVGDKIKLAKEPKYPAREIIAVQDDAYYFDEAVYLPFIHQNEWELVEQNHTDKVEPKFKVGDWVVNNNGKPRVFRVEKQDWPDFIISSSLGNQFINTATLKKQYHLWTIQDAKDGDVLYLQHEGVEHVIIYKGLVKKNFDTFLSAYCAYNGCVHDFCFADVSFYARITSELNEKEIHPATKGQCDLLFTKMKEAGYEWDGEKKELKKIEQKTAENIDNLHDYLYGEQKPAENIDNLHDYLYGEQKPAWCEEDAELTDFESALFSAFSDAWQEYLLGKEVDVEKWAREHSAELLEVAREQISDWSEKKPIPKFKVGDCIYDKRDSYNRNVVREVGDDYYINAFGQKMDMAYTNANFEFLKHLEDDHIDSKPASWSEKDEKMFSGLNSIVEDWYNTMSEQEKEYYGDCGYIDWLKSLKERVQPKQEWKQENTGDLTDFENAMMHIGESFFGKNAGLNPNDTNTIKEQANILSELVQSKEWSEEDEEMFDAIIADIQFTQKAHTHDVNQVVYEREIDWFKAIKERYTWKPSDEQMEAFEHFVRSVGESGYASPYNNNTRLLYSLLEQLKKLREE